MIQKMCNLNLLHCHHKTFPENWDSKAPSVGTLLAYLGTTAYRMRAIITRGLYYFYLIFHCGLYSREVYIAERLVLQGNFF